MRRDRIDRNFNQKVGGLYLRKVDNELTYEGMYHHKMLIRSTNKKYKASRPTYEDVAMSDNFKDFQYFAEWCNTQTGFGDMGFVLDKDIIKPRNKTYSEDVCVFVPDSMNNFFTFVHQKDRGLPVGVSWCESEQKFKSYCSQLNGKNKTLGRFNNPEDAHIAYCVYKEKMAVKLANAYKDNVDSRVTEALLDFKVSNYTKEKI